jgi:hypothetical protein
LWKAAPLPLREENRKQKGIVADITLGKHILQEMLSEKT